MLTAQLIISERSGRWAPALRSALRGAVQLMETRALAQCEASLRAAPKSLVALAITEKNLSQGLEFIVRVGRDYPAARLIALLEPEMESAEPLLREAGVADVIRSPLQAVAIARLARWHVARLPAEHRPLRELVAASLPWEPWATPGFAASITSPQD